MQGLVQHFGSCWFYSSWNGFLLSYRGRKFLREYLSYERPENTHNLFWERTRQFLNKGPFPLNNIDEKKILAGLNVNARCGGSNNTAFKALSKLFGNKIAYNLNLHTNSTPLPLVVLITYNPTDNGNAGGSGNAGGNGNGIDEIPPTYEFKGHTYVISHCRVNIGPSQGRPGHSMTGVIAADGTEFIFDSGLKPNGQFWKFNWTKGPICDHEGDELAYFDGYDVFYVLEDLMTLPNKPHYVRPIAGRPPIRRAAKPGAATKKNVT